MLLESGGRVQDPVVQQLNDGDQTGDSYRGLAVTRYRQLGGTPSLWFALTATETGGKFVPLDEVDLEPRWEHAPNGWPINYATLRAYYHKAEAICGVGATSGVLATPLASPALAAPLTPAEYQFGTYNALVRPLIRAVDESPHCQVLTNATVTGLEAGSLGVAVRVAFGEQEPRRLHARCVVLAAGAVENARLLLLADSNGGSIDRSGWLGRGFMEHPRDRSITIRQHGHADYHDLGFYDQRANETGQLSAGRMALEASFLREHGQLNASVTLLPNVKPERAQWREMLRRFRVPPPQRWFPAEGHGWSRHPAPHAVYDGLTALINLEQPPHRDNAVMLGRRRDRFGNALPELQFHWHDDDQQRLVQLRRTVANSLRASGFPDVTVDESARPDPNAHHHAGTTRMDDDPLLGVVDADCRVHGAPAIYVAGASVFPTCGFANPTLTIVAMALRLADHLGA
jgi:choline dehydrogenase-like flavoprotein